jgi:hypothetical protein
MAFAGEGPLAKPDDRFHSLETVMIKTLMAVAVAGVFALPVAASAASDNIVVSQAGGGGSGSGGGADAPDMANRQPGTTSQPGTMESDKMNAGATQRPARGATGTSTRGRFDLLDTNGDGFISRDEAKDAPELQTRFSELDKDNDGKLSREEYGALNEAASGATGTGRTSGSGAEPRQPGRSATPGKGAGDASTSGSNTK